jgi:uncharacterized phage-associated protein
MPRQRVSFEYDFDKVLAALVYFAAQPELVTRLDKKKALSLIFLADKRHLLRYGEPIFGDYYAAPPLGAVPQETWRRLNRFLTAVRAGVEPRGKDVEQLAEALSVVTDPSHSYPVFRARVSPDMSVLSTLEQKALEDIANQYGRHTFEDLKEPTHPPAWHKARASGRLKPADRRNLMAPLMRYEDFFEDDPEAIEGAREQMIADFELRRALSGRR